MLYIAVVALAILAIADHLTGTAFYQRNEATMFAINPDHFDIFADDDEAIEADIRETLSFPSLRLAADEMTSFSILTDEELDTLPDEDYDAVNADIAAWYDDDPIEAALFFSPSWSDEWHEADEDDYARRNV